MVILLNTIYFAIVKFMSNPNISPIIPVNNLLIQQKANTTRAKVVPSQGNLSQYIENTLFNPSQQARRFEDLRKLKGGDKKEGEEETKAPGETQIKAVTSSEEAASRFEENNPELSTKTLTILAGLISEDDTPQETLAKVFSVYPDPALADEALDFLIETAKPNTRALLQETKELLNKEYERQVRSGRTIGALSREFSKEGLGSPTALRDLYRDVTGNQRAPLKLFDELVEQYPYQNLRAVIIFMLHSLGADLKSKGPSIDRADLIRLIEETRSLQGILGVFRFFQSKAKLLDRQFLALGLERPSQVNFQTLSRLLIKMLQERFINPEKIIETAKLLGIEDEVKAQIAVYAQMYEGLRQISPRYYRSPKHRNELIKTFVDTLEELEEQSEEEDDEEEKKKKEKK